VTGCVNRWTDRGYQSLYEYALSDTDDDNYLDLTRKIAASGTPAVLLIIYQDEVSKLWRASEKNVRVSSTSIAWIGVDAWIDQSFDDPDVLKNGIVGLSVYKSNDTVRQDFTRVWESLDAKEYPDTDGDRSTLATYTPYLVDSVFALALAYQATINADTGLDGAYFRQQVFTEITKIVFSGVSGVKDFNSYGDMVNPLYSIQNYHNYSGTKKWMNVGYSNNTYVYVNLQDVIWPDGSKGKTSSYSHQLSPLCPPGSEPADVVSMDDIKICSQCQVGFYSPDFGSEPCYKCPMGADCGDVGVAIPCIRPGYWRQEPPFSEIGNFNKYEVFKCDIEESCRGGCLLNETCKSDILQTSPVCGVCSEGYYNAGNKCDKCTSESRSLYIGRFFIEAVVVFSAILALLWAVTSQEIQAVAARATTGYVESKSEAEKYGGFMGHLFFIVSRIIPRGVVTAKLIISFWQVLTNGFFTLSLEWPRSMRVFVSLVSINPLNRYAARVTCDNSDEQQSLINLTLMLCLPFVFFLLLLGSYGVVYFRVVLPLQDEKQNKLSEDKFIAAKTALRDISIKTIVWFCLITFAGGSTT
jgi:hypothetical protein